MKRMIRKSAAVAVCTVMMIPSAAHANLDDLLSEPVEGLLEREIYIASKRSESMKEAPGVVSIVTREDIDRYGGRNLTDILGRLPGVNIGGGSLYRNNVLAIRGQSYDIDTQNLIMINGRPFRDMVSSGIHSPIFQNFPVSIIDHIEVIRGPGSVLHGSHAFTGVINIVTQDPEQDQVRFATMHGTHRYSQQEISFAKTFPEGHVLASGKRLETDGPRFSVIDSASVRDSDNWKWDSHGGYAELEYDNLSVSAFSGYEDQRHLGVSPTWPSVGAKNRTSMADIGYRQELSESWSNQTNLTYNGHKQYVGEMGPNIETPLSHGAMLETAFTGTLADNANLLVGGSYENFNSSMKSLGGEYDTRRSTGYAQLDYRPWEPLKLIGGIQVNKIEGLEENFSPRAGAIVDITDYTGVKVLYSEAYKGPVGSTTVLLTPQIEGDPNLNPELIRTWDVQWFLERDQYYITTSYFRSRTTDLMDARFVPALGKLKYSNGSEVISEGVEVEAKYALNDVWEVTGSLSFNSVEEGTVKNDAFFAPNRMAKAGISYLNAPQGVTAGIFYQHIGPAADIRGRMTNPLAVKTNPVPDDFNLLTANLKLHVNNLLDWRAMPETELSFYGYNLLDETSYYPEVQTLQINSMPWEIGRTVYGGVAMRF